MTTLPAFSQTSAPFRTLIEPPAAYYFPGENTFERRFEFAAEDIEYALLEEDNRFRIDPSGLRANKVSSLTIRYPDGSDAYFIRFDTIGQVVAVAGCLNYRSDDIWVDSLQRYPKEQKGGFYVNKQSGHGWGSLTISAVDSNKQLRVRKSYWNGRMEAIDSSLRILCPTTSAESELSAVQEAYRTGSLLTKEQAYFNDKFYNQSYPCPPPGNNARCRFSWFPSPAFWRAQGANDSTYFTKKLDAVYASDSLYHFRRTTKLSNESVVVEDLLPWPVFIEPSIDRARRLLRCGTQVYIPAPVPKTMFLSNGLPSASGFTYSGANQGFNAEYLYTYTYFDGR